MNDPCLAPSAGGSRRCDAKAMGASARTPVARGLTELWQISARNDALSPQGAQDFPWPNLCCPHCSKGKVLAHNEPKGWRPSRHLGEPRLSTLPVAVLAAPLAWRQQWLA